MIAWNVPDPRLCGGFKILGNGEGVIPGELTQFLGQK